MNPLTLSAAADAAPFLRSRWEPAEVTLAQAAALLPPLAVVLVAGGGPQALLLATSLAVTFFWETLFALLRGRAWSWHGVTTALVVAVMVPAGAPLWQLALALSLGVVLGELIFGGRGFGFLAAGVVALAFLRFSFATIPFAGDSDAVAMATLPGAALLLYLRLISWRVALAALLGFAAARLAAGQPLEPAATGASLAFGLVFLICDPFGAASTNAGRWLYGALAGGLAVVFDTAPGAAVAPEAIVFAALLASIFAPLLDHAAVLVIARIRRRRHG